MAGRFLVSYLLVRRYSKRMRTTLIRQFGQLGCLAGPTVPADLPPLDRLEQSGGQKNSKEPLLYMQDGRIV